MSSGNARDFEFKLGKLGLLLFTFGIALLLLFSFLFGVMVGKNIETYPEKIAKGIPKAIKEKIVEKSSDVISHTSKEDRSKDIEKEKDDFKLTFYDTLTKKDKNFKHDMPKEVIHPKKKREIKKTSVKGQYLIQVASFKDKKKVERLQRKLSDMGYSPRVDETKLSSSGKWFRLRLEGYSTSREARQVSASLEKKIRGLKCLVMRQKK
jgi:cell division protein FtsN